MLRKYLTDIVPSMSYGGFDYIFNLLDYKLLLILAASFQHTKIRIIYIFIDGSVFYIDINQCRTFWNNEKDLFLGIYFILANFFVLVKTRKVNFLHQSISLGPSFLTCTWLIVAPLYRTGLQPGSPDTQETWQHHQGDKEGCAGDTS